MKQPWYEYQSNRNALARWLDDHSEFTNPSDVIYYFEKPWKYDREWDEYQAEKTDAKQSESRLATA